MGRCGGGSLFNPVAKALQQSGARDRVRYEVANALLGALTDYDFDDLGEEYDRYKGDRQIAQAFKDNDLGPICGYENIDTFYCELPEDHVTRHRDFQGTEFE